MAKRKVRSKRVHSKRIRSRNMRSKKIRSSRRVHSKRQIRKYSKKRYRKSHKYSRGKKLKMKTKKVGGAPRAPGGAPRAPMPPSYIAFTPPVHTPTVPGFGRFNKEVIHEGKTYAYDDNRDLIFTPDGYVYHISHPVVADIKSKIEGAE